MRRVEKVEVIGVMMWRWVRVGREGSFALDGVGALVSGWGASGKLIVRWWQFRAAHSRVCRLEMGKSTWRCEKMEGVAVETRLQQARDTRRRFRRVDLGRNTRSRRIGKSREYVGWCMWCMWWSLLLLWLVWTLGRSGGVLEGTISIGEEILLVSFAGGRFFILNMVGFEGGMSSVSLNMLPGILRKIPWSAILGVGVHLLVRKSETDCLTSEVNV